MVERKTKPERFNYFRITKELYTKSPRNLSRRNYWLFTLLNCCVLAILGTVFMLVNIPTLGNIMTTSTSTTGPTIVTNDDEFYIYSPTEEYPSTEEIVTAVTEASPATNVVNGILGILTLLFALYLIPTNILSIIARLHNAGFNGAWVLLDFLPYMGWLPLLIMCCLKEMDENPYL